MAFSQGKLLSPRSAQGPPSSSGNLGSWLAAELRAERQAIAELLVVRHDALLNSLQQAKLPDPPTILETPKCVSPFRASGRSDKGPSQPQAEGILQACFLASDDGEEETGISFSAPGVSEEGGGGNASNAAGADPTNSQGVLSKSTSFQSKGRSPRAASHRSLVYGDRHPDQGLFHCDFSSCHAFVKGPCFETFFAILILVNTVFMALEYQFNGLRVGLEMEYPDVFDMGSLWPWAPEAFQASEWVFGLAFTFELVLKLIGLRCSFFQDMWNYLDVLIVMFWILDVLPLDPMLLRVMRLAKLLRLIKLAKSIKSFDSLYLLTASIASSASALVWSGILICIVQLLVALVLSTFLLPYCVDESFPLDDRLEVYRYFGTFSKSMLSMFELTLGNWVPISRILSEKVSEWFTIFTLAFQIVLGFAVIKVITGVFLTETMKVASMDDSIMLKTKERAVRLHKDKMRRLFEHADLDASGSIDCVEFHQLLCDKEVRAWLASMELEIFSDNDGDALFSMIDDGDGVITLDELIKGVARLKGQARGVDLALVRACITELSQDIMKMQQKMKRRPDIFIELGDEESGDHVPKERFGEPQPPAL
ncbi:unnamed protein product [Effrenium voratum]|uniref:EF-hand domain-containing protein n=1 Tax=Effrenium voratum TaxID=2562239 RepID=A0AA36J801_9DINO|nr:unnamed protein product [Effrenium voratum]